MENVVQGSGFRDLGSGVEMLIASTIAKLQSILIAIVYACML